MRIGPLLMAAGTGAALGAWRAADDPLTELRPIEVPALAGAGQQNLATGPDGRVYLSWIERRPDSAFALRFAVLGGGSWSTPRTIAEGRDWFVNWADFPSLAVLGPSELAAHWLVRSGLGRYSYDVVLSRSNDGGATWSAPVVPHRDRTASEHGFVSLWPAGGGALAAVWVDGRKYAASEAARARGDSSLPAEMNLRVATLSPRGELGPETEVDTRVCDCCQTAAALTADGPVLVYRDRSPREIRDIAIVRQVNGAWTAPRTVADDGWEINACPVNGPAVDAAGRRVAVAWYTGAQERRRVQVAFSSDAGASFGAPTRVDDGRAVGRVALVLLDDGSALVSWLEDTGSGAEVRVRRMSPGGERGDAQVIARTSAGRPSGFPRMVRSGERLVFAWRDPDDREGARVRSAVARLR